MYGGISVHYITKPNILSTRDREGVDFDIAAYIANRSLRGVQDQPD